GLPHQQRVHAGPRGHRLGGAAHRGRDAAGAGRPAGLAEADRERELRVPGRAPDHGHLVQRQVRRGHGRAPLLRRLPERGHRRGPRGRARPRAVRGALCLRPAALRDRRQPGRLLVDPRQPRGVAVPAEDAVQERQRALRGRLGDAAPRVRQPATARHVAGRGRPPHPRLPSQHQRQDVPPAAVRHRPGDRSARLRRGRGQGARVQAARAGGRVLRLPPPRRLRQDARDRRRGGRRADGRHGPLRRSRRGQGVHGGRGPGAARPHHHHDDPQVAPRSARRHGAGAGGVRRRRRPRLPDGARRSAVPRHGGQGRRLRRGPHQLLPGLRADGGRQREVPGRGLPQPGRHAGHRRHRQPHRAARRDLLRPDRSPGGVGAPRRGHRDQPQLGPGRPQRRLVHLRRPPRHARPDDPRVRARRVRQGRRADRRGAEQHRARDHQGRRAVEGVVRPGRRRGRPGQGAVGRAARQAPALPRPRPRL
ncbi:MAG: Serine hydroxymethyltransferase, partial [uncultured Nocardioides sp.]